MGATHGCCTTRDAGPGAAEGSGGPKRAGSPRSAEEIEGSKPQLPKASSAAARAPLRSPGSGTEPDAEPEDEQHHEDFVRVLRLRIAKEEDPEFWALGDLTAEATCAAIGRAVEELRLYLGEWRASGSDAFWHRKSHQVVLAVAVCRGAGGELGVYRGMNTEVSLPAGSLCAERAAIARAASDFRAAGDLLAVAVVDPQDRINPLWPCEVCQSWLAKLRDESSAISVVAVRSSACDCFVVRVNGVLQPKPRPAPAPPPAALAGRVRLAEGVEEQPWEARQLVYVDGAWDSDCAVQWGLLRAAKAKGTHVLAGIHSDETLRRQLGGEPREPLETRLGRLLEDRHVSSVLTDAPWCLTEELITGLGIRRVVTETKTVERRQKWCSMSYEAARKRDILEVVSPR